MYVNAKVLVQRSNVYALPQQALMVSGNQTYCYLLQDGKAVKTPVQAGISDGTWVEVDQMKIDDPWVKVTGDEDVILGDLSELTDGQTVKAVEKQGTVSPRPAVRVAEHAGRVGPPPTGVESGP